MRRRRVRTRNLRVRGQSNHGRYIESLQKRERDEEGHSLPHLYIGQQLYMSLFTFAE